MELYVETLTGTAFELRVSPFETVLSVKAKIQRLEGIPVAQQHLIWQSVELEDDYCLHDYGIQDGATLKLVLAMRGGPINTRRIPMEDTTLREMAEYMEANRDDILDKIPGNRQVTLLVYREGDQLNFFRVVDKGDGTLSPLTESLSGASVYNLYDDDEEEEDSDEVPSLDLLQENDKTKEKMKLLRTKMESLSLNKKPKKSHMPRPPSVGKSGSRNKLRRFPSYSSSKLKGHVLNKNACLPPVGHTYTTNTYATKISPIELSPSPEIHVESEVDLEPTLAGDESSPDIAAEKDKDFVLNKAAAGLADKLIRSSISQALNVKHRHSGMSPPVLRQMSSPASANDSIETLLQKAQLSGKAKSRSSSQEGPRTNATFSGRSKREMTVNSLKDSISLRSGDISSANPSKGLERILDSLEQEGSETSPVVHKDVTYDRLREGLVPHPPSTSKYSERKPGIVLESLSQKEARAMSGLLRQASLERLGSSKLSTFIPSASKARRGYAISPGSRTEAGRIPTPEGRLMSSRLQKLSASRDGRVLSSGQRLPPVKQKKKASKRCLTCAKKTGLATSYQCRCGNNFCATHRYAESHDCKFDYKTEGRKLLEQSNPVVTAPKLPKI